MTDEELVAALAESLWGDEDDRRRQAVKLLPVVRRVAEQRAAEELLAAANDWAYLTERSAPAQRFVRARAAALTATPNHGTDAT